MKNMKTRLTALLLGMMWLLLGTYGALAAGTQTIKVGYMPIGDCLQLYVAQDMGFFAQNGIAIEKMAMKGGAVIAPALEAGEVEVGWSNSVSIIIAHAKGFDFTFLTSGALSLENGHRVHSLLVAADSPITDPEGLKGRKVAINTLGNINQLSMLAFAKQNHMTGRDFKLLEIPFPEMETALKNKSVDAILAVEPFVTLSTSHGTAKMLVRSIHQSFGQKFMIGSWFVKKSWVKKNPGKAKAFATAINAASGYIMENPDKVAQFLVNNTKMTSDLIAKISLPAFDPAFDLQDLQPMIDMAAEFEFIAKPYPAAEIVTDPLE